jgi:hypothetical protein
VTITDLGTGSGGTGTYVTSLSTFTGLYIPSEPVFFVVADQTVIQVPINLAPTTDNNLIQTVVV